MGTREAYWILDMLGQAEHLLSQLPCCLEFPPVDIKNHQASQHWEELRGVPRLPAQLARPVIGGSHFWSRYALGNPQRRAKDDGQREFLLDTFGGIREGFEQLQSLGEVSDRFQIG